MSEDVQEHIKLYYKIGGGLLGLTVLTVLVSYLPFGVPLAIVVALVVAGVKGSLVASYFMHLIGERRSIYAALGLTVFFFLVLLLIPILGHSSTYGEHKPYPNSNPPTFEVEGH